MIMLKDFKLAMHEGTIWKKARVGYHYETIKPERVVSLYNKQNAELKRLNNKVELFERYLVGMPIKTDSESLQIMSELYGDDE